MEQRKGERETAKKTQCLEMVKWLKHKSLVEGLEDKEIF